MKKLIIAICFLGIVIQAKAQVNKSSKEVVQSFFTNFKRGDVEGVIATFSDTAKIISINKKGFEGANLYGTFKGKEGVRTFLDILANTFDTKSFTVDHIIAENSIAFAKGSFVHQLKTTGKLFKSDWALMCAITNNKIEEYRFFEDSASFIKASQ